MTSTSRKESDVQEDRQFHRAVLLAGDSIHGVLLRVGRTEMTERKDQLDCCMAMIQAQQSGTDNEMYGALVRYYDPDNTVWMGCDLPPITFCPWCGKKIKRKT